MDIKLDLSWQGGMKGSGLIESAGVSELFQGLSDVVCLEVQLQDGKPHVGVVAVCVFLFA